MARWRAEVNAIIHSDKLAAGAPSLAPMVIEVNFLSPTILAASKTDRTEPEWPLQPARLFNALVAALHSIHEADPSFAEAEAAVTWLETLGPPDVHAAPEDGSFRPTSYVPFNDSPYAKGGRLEACLPGSPRRNKARVTPGVTVRLPIIRYTWQVNPAGLARQRTGLQLLLACIPYLGRASNFVIMRLLELPPESLPHAEVLDRWTPSTQGTRRMRTFAPGRLQELRRLYDDDRPVDYGPANFYLRAGEEPPPEPVPGPWSPLWTAFTLRSLRVTAEDTEAAAKSIRRAIITRMAGTADPAKVDPFFSGHEADGSPTRVERMAVVPLSNILHSYADGRIMGFAILMPDGVSQDRWMEMSSLFFGGDGRLALNQVQIGSETAVIGQVERRVEALSPDRYVGTSAIWTTVTPILLSRRPDKARTPHSVIVARVLEQVAADCVASGLPQPVRVVAGPVSSLQSVGQAASFRQCRGGPRRWATHATLYFDRPISGPLLVGAGRYNGLGLLMPLSDGGN